jgi:hypothetical protein
MKPLVLLLVAAQLLLAVPAMAFAQTTSASTSSTTHDECPCCPEGADSMKDCLASCTLAAVASSNVPLPARPSAPSLGVEGSPSAPLASLADPPLKPPPIR